MYRITSQSVALSRFNFDVVDAEVRGPDGGVLTRSWAQHPPTVGIVGIDEGGRVPLIRQYRSSVDQWNLELPGGRIDEGEDPARAALRELQEETGAVAETAHRLGSFLNSPGHCSQESLLFWASVSGFEGRALDDGEEATSKVEFVDLADVDHAVASGAVRDAKTIIGLLLIQRLRGRA